jgi:hypothetical protein
LRGPFPTVHFDDEPERHCRFFDRPLLVARPHRCGAMARLIDYETIIDCPPANRRAFLFQVNSHEPDSDRYHRSKFPVSGILIFRDPYCN